MTHTAEHEREAIVAWLRAEVSKDVPFDLDTMAALGLVLDVAAAAIQRGEHIKGGENG